jgi:chaperone modulatory protein CbpM
MADKDFAIQILDEQVIYSLQDICTICDTQTDVIVGMVEYGILDPMGFKQELWQFDAQALQRSKTALRLRRDLDINLSGLALALDLLDELTELRRRVKNLEQQLQSFHQ